MLSDVKIVLSPAERCTMKEKVCVGGLREGGTLAGERREDTYEVQDG